MNHNIHCNAENVEKGGQNPSLHQMADHYNLFSIRKRISPKTPVWMLPINEIISGSIDYDSGDARFMTKSSDPFCKSLCVCKS